MKYEAEVVKRYVERLLTGHGAPVAKAGVSAEVLVEADLRGIFSHGINSLDLLIINSIKAGGTDPQARPEILTNQLHFPIRHIDAHGDLGHPVAKSAVEIVKGLAREHGLGKVYVYHANHFGAAAIYSEDICREKDLAGRVTCTAPAMMRPYGGSRNRFGTNVVAWSAPYHEGVVTIDMATTIHAVSGIMKALLEGQPLPFPVYDQEGLETTDPGRFQGPQDFRDRGSMIPLGGLGREKGEQADAGYKGAGLAALIELDSAIGGGMSTWVDPTSQDEGRWIRQTFEAWRIDTLFPQAEALQHLSATIADIRTYGGPEMLLPGEKELKQREISLREGIAYSPAQIGRLEKLGSQVGLGRLA